MLFITGGMLEIAEVMIDVARGIGGNGLYSRRNQEEYFIL